MIAQLFVVSFCTNASWILSTFCCKLYFAFALLLFEIKFCWALFLPWKWKKKCPISIGPTCLCRSDFSVRNFVLFYGDKRLFLYLIMFFHLLILLLPLQTLIFCINMFVFASLSSAKWNKNSSCLPAIYVQRSDQTEFIAFRSLLISSLSIDYRSSKSKKRCEEISRRELLPCCRRISSFFLRCRRRSVTSQRWNFCVFVGMEAKRKANKHNFSVSSPALNRTTCTYAFTKDNIKCLHFGHQTVEKFFASNTQK